MSTVLVVEDSRSQRECISHQLSCSGLNIIQASDGVEALAQAEKKCPDLVLLDIVMPLIRTILIKKIQQTRPCKICYYYYGKDKLNCAVHPAGRPQEVCRDWEFN